jgi:uracil-DNA glycosylase
MEFDPGPPPELAAIFAALPDHRPFDRFRLEWGPKFYRGRTDGTARVLVIGQDAASEEDIARRNFVGDAGRRVQGFLAKCGITRSYFMVNAFAYSVRGQFDSELAAIAETAALAAWRAAVLDWALDRNPLEGIIAFGSAAAHALDTWPGAPSGVFVARPRHPSARPLTTLLGSWRFWIPRLRPHLAPDGDGDPSGPNYLPDAFRPGERPAIPRRDLPFAMPAWFGQDALKTTVRRESDLIEWRAPAGSVG